MFTIIAILFLVLNVYLVFRRLEYSILFCFSVKLLIPYYFKIFNVSYFSIVIFLTFFLFFIKNLIHHKVYETFLVNKMSKDVCLLSIVLLLISLFGTNFTSDITQTIRDSIANFTLMFMIFQIKDLNQLKRLCYGVLVVGLVVCIYGLFNYIAGVNPYIEALELLNPEEKFFVYEEERFGFSSRVQSTLFHSITFGGYMMILSFFPLFLFKGSLRWVFSIPFILGAFITASRSVLIGLLCGYFVYFIILNFKLKARIILSTILISFTLFSMNAGFRDFFLASVFIWDDSYAKSANVQGSSLSMRQGQLDATIDFVPADRVLTGLGITYFENHKLNEKLWKLESAFFRLYICTGLIGVLVWIWFLFNRIAFVWRLYQVTHVSRTVLLQSLTISFLVFILATGFMDMIFIYIFLFALTFNFFYLKFRHGSLNNNSKL